MFDQNQINSISPKYEESGTKWKRLLVYQRCIKLCYPQRAYQEAKELQEKLICQDGERESNN